MAWVFLIVLLHAILIPMGIVAARMYRRSTGPRAGRCPCGYDLRGSPVRGVCPECGRARWRGRTPDDTLRLGSQLCFGVVVLVDLLVVVGWLLFF